MPLPIIAGAILKLLPLVSAVPEVVKAIQSGNGEEAVGKVFDVAKRLTGKGDPDEAATQIINTPELQLKFQEALIAERTEYARIASAERMAQIKVNEVEAASDDKFKSRWRPATGWVGVIALFMATVPKAVVITVAWCIQVHFTFQQAAAGTVPQLPAFPDLGVSDAIAILCALLGIGGMRTLERVKGKIGPG